MDELIHRRLASLREVLHKHELAALLITSPHNLRYMSGFSGSAGALLVAAEAAILFTDFRYLGRAAQEAPTFEVRQITKEIPLEKLLTAAAEEYGLRQLGFEAAHMSVARYNKLQKAMDEASTSSRLELLPTEHVVEPLREVKDSHELAKLRRAVAITDEALEALLPVLTPEHTERQVAWLLEVAMRERGAEAVSFPIIVAAGRNAALPHAQTGDALLGSGQPIVIDMGARYEGYHADLTRTIVLGEPDERFWNVYQTVLETQQDAIRNIRPGMTGIEADTLARDRLTAAGFGAAFGHSLGHGVGLDIHEGPTLGRTGERELRVGNVFSVEPGIYLEEWGGVRIEDLVLLREDGCEVLSQARKM